MEPHRTSLSIIMPVFNHRDDVATMIDSIRANNFQSWELLAIDDGSEEDTLQLLEQYAEADRRIRVVRRDRLPKGAQTCRNIGMERAKGEYIVFFDSDDYIAPYCLRQRVEAMSHNVEFDFMVFPSGLYENGKLLCVASPYVYGYKIFDDDMEQFAKRQLPFIVWNNIYRTASLRKFGVKWDEQLLSLQDADFNVSSLVSGMRYAYATGAKADYGYRIASVSSVSKHIRGDKHIMSHLYAVKKMCGVFQNFCGRRYEWSLFSGALCIYNGCMSGNGLNSQLADGLVSVLRASGCRYWMLLRVQVFLSKMLARFFSEKLSRQLPMGFYLVERTLDERRKMKHLESLGLIKE